MVVQVKARLVEGTEVLVETSRPGARQGKEEGVRLAAEVGLVLVVLVVGVVLVAGGGSGGSGGDTGAGAAHGLGD